MIAILVHFLGHLLVDSAIPPWAGSADAYFLAMWFMGFAAVDLVACAFADTQALRIILGLSFAWSISLALEQAMLLDWMHPADWVAQIAIDGALFVLFVMILAKAVRHPKEKSA